MRDITIFALALSGANAAVPKVVASNYRYHTDMNYIMYDMDVVWPAEADMDYQGFATQTWGFCHTGAWPASGNLSALQLCEANRLGNLNSAETGYCSGKWDEVANTPNAATSCITTNSDATSTDGCMNPNCWVSACNYDKWECKKVDTGENWNDALYKNNNAVSTGNTKLRGLTDMCSWDENYNPRAWTSLSTSNEYKAHAQVNDLERISEQYFTKWIYDGTTAKWTTPSQGMPLMSTTDYAATTVVDIHQHDLQKSTFTDSTGLKVAVKFDKRGKAYTQSQAHQTHYFNRCKEGDTISAFTVTRGSDGVFSYGSIVRIGTFSKKNPGVARMTPTKFSFDSTSTATSATWFLMKDKNFQQDSGNISNSTLAIDQNNFGCLPAGKVANEWIGGWALGPGGIQDENSIGNSEVTCHDSGNANTMCPDGGIKELLNGDRDIFTANCTKSVPGGWDGFVKCTLEVTTSTLAQLCDAGDVLVNIDSRRGNRNTMSGTATEDGVDEFTDAIIGHFLETPLALKSTEFLFSVAEDDIAFPNPAFNHPSVNIDDITLLIGCSATAVEPAAFWEVANDNRQRFDADTATTDGLTAADRASNIGTFTMFNSIHNELHTFSDDCKYGNYVVGSLDGHTWTKMARIAHAQVSDQSGYTDPVLNSGAQGTKAAAAAVAGAAAVGAMLI